jgi:hypothetical protein
MQPSNNQNGHTLKQQQKYQSSLKQPHQAAATNNGGHSYEQQEPLQQFHPQQQQQQQPPVKQQNGYHPGNYMSEMMHEANSKANDPKYNTARQSLLLSNRKKR